MPIQRILPSIKACHGQCRENLWTSLCWHTGLLQQHGCVQKGHFSVQNPNFSLWSAWQVTPALASSAVVALITSWAQAQPIDEKRVLEIWNDGPWTWPWQLREGQIDALFNSHRAEQLTCQVWLLIITRNMETTMWLWFTHNMDKQERKYNPKVIFDSQDIFVALDG